MSKRKVRFDEEEQDLSEKGDSSRRFKAKHSLDSDEEDEENDEKESKAYNILTEDDVEGQEEDTIDHDGEIKITPFNLREEMEDGYFDSEGNYFERKDKEIRDDWLDSVDWVKVKELQKGQDDSMGDTSGQFDDANEINTKEYLEKIVAIIKPRETILSAIRRLGGKPSSASDRLKAKKKKVDGDQQKSDENKEQLLMLTELADGLLNSGEFDIYQATYEKCQYRLKALAESKKEVDEDDALEAAYNDSNENGDKASGKASAAEKEEDNEVYWQYKWDSEKSSELFGPFSSSEMLDWTNQGYFKDGVLVRKLVNKSTAGEGQFYNSKRIDFELYT